MEHIQTGLLQQVNQSGSVNLIILLLSGTIIICLLFALFYFRQQVKSAVKRNRDLQEEVDHISSKELSLHDLLIKQQSVQEQLLARQDLTNRLLRMVRSTLQTTSLNVAFEKILDASCGATGAEIGSLFLLDASGRVTDSYLSRRSGGVAETKKLTGQVMRDGLAGWLVKTGQAIILDDAQADSRWITLPNEPYVAGSVLGVPITNGITVTGILTLIHSNKGHFRIDDLGLMQDAASQIALAIRNAQIFEEQRRMVERQTSLYDVLRLISQNLRSDLVSLNTVEKVAEITEWSMVALFAPDNGFEYLVPIATAGEYAPPRDFKVKLDQNSAAGRSFLLGKTELVSNPTPVPEHTPFHTKLASELFVPIKFNGHIQSLLCFGDQNPYLFSDEEVTLAESITEAVSLAIANAELFEKTADQRSRLQALISASHDGIILIGLDQTVLVINQPALDALCLHGTPHDWLHRPLTDLSIRVTGINESFAEQLLNIASADGLPTEAEMAEMGQEVEISKNVYQVSFTPVLGDVESIGTLCVLRDITEERLLDRMRDDLTRSIVHDLKNPLWMLDSSLKLLKDNLDDGGHLGDQETEFFHISSTQVERMLGLVNAILEISRLEDRKIPLNEELIDIQKPIRDMLKLLEPQALDKSITMFFNEKKKPIYLWADEGLIQRVLQNLVGNALKFTPKEGRIVVSVDQASDEMIKVSVQDSGPGISLKVLNRIFEKFTTGDVEESGTGLGLAFCKMAIEAHGGSIYVEETSSIGTTFVFTLPFLAEAQNSMEDESLVDQSLTTSNGNGNGPENRLPEKVLDFAERNVTSSAD